MIPRFLTQGWLIVVLVAIGAYSISQVILKLHPIVIGILSICVMIFLIFHRKPLMALAFFILFVPFSATLFFNARLEGTAPGLKPLNFLALFVIGIAFLNQDRMIKMPRYAWAFSLWVASMTLTNVFRSMANLDVLSYYFHDNLSPLRYILSYYIKPMVYFVPFVIILKLGRKISDIEYVLRSLIISISVASVFALILYATQCPSKTNFEQIRFFLGSFFGLHGNDLVNFYIVIYPIALMFLLTKKNIPSLLFIGFVTAVIGLLFSRTAYLTVFVSTVLYLVISKRTKYLPVLGICFLLLAVAPAAMKQRAFQDVHSGDINKISAGRVGDLWMPLLEEYFNDPAKLMMGNGSFSIVSSKSFANGAILRTQHPHNMYIEQLLDSGLIGASIYIYFYALIFVKIFKSLSRIEDIRIKEYQRSFFVSFTAYLFSGLFGRSMIPEHNNAFLWVILGCAVLLAEKSREILQEKS